MLAKHDAIIMIIAIIVSMHLLADRPVHGADLKMQNDLIAVVSREELTNVGTGGPAQRVKAAVWVDINDDRHCSCVRL